MTFVQLFVGVLGHGFTYFRGSGIAQLYDGGQAVSECKGPVRDTGIRQLRFDMDLHSTVLETLGHTGGARSPTVYRSIIIPKV